MSCDWSDVGADVARRLIAAAPRLPLEQGWAYARGMEVAGVASPRFLALGERAVAVVYRSRWWGLWPVRECLRGPVWIRPPDDAARRDDAIAMFLRAAFPRSAFALSFWTPDHGEAGPMDAVARAAGMRRVQTGHATVILQVATDEVAQRSMMQGKWRSALAAAEARGGLRVRATREKRAASEVLERYEALRRARRFAGPAGAVLAGAMAAGEGRGASFAVIAERGSSVEAGGLFLVHGDEATWVAGFATAAGRDGGGHRRVLAMALRELRMLGIARLDLGGIDTEGAPGIARFKLGLGGRVAVLPGTWGR